MKLRPTVLVFLLFLISPVSSGDELDQSQKLHRKTYMTSVEVMNYLAENLSLAWASVYGEVDVNYSIREQINNLALAKSKFEEFDRLLERYSDLKVTSKDGVKHKSIMLEQLYSSRPVLIEMIAQGDAVRLATESQDTVVLEKADVEFMRQSILHLESENASLSAAVYQIELWHPTLWLNQCIEASNKVVIEMLRMFIAMNENPPPEDYLRSTVISAQRHIRSLRGRITIGFKKADELVDLAKNDPRILGRTSIATMEKVADTYVDSFKNESILADVLEELLDYQSKALNEGNIQSDVVKKEFDLFELKFQMVGQKRAELHRERLDLFEYQ